MIYDPHRRERENAREINKNLTAIIVIAISLTFFTNLYSVSMRDGAVSGYGPDNHTNNAGHKTSDLTTPHAEMENKSLCDLQDVVCDSEPEESLHTDKGESVKLHGVERFSLASTQAPLSPKTIIKKGASKETQEKIDYAWEVSGHDKDFIYMLEYENAGTWDVKKRSGIIGANGYYDWGIAQINEGYHKGIVHDPRFFKDYKFQIDSAYGLYKGGTRFYGYDHRWKVVKNFIIK